MIARKTLYLMTSCLLISVAALAYPNCLKLNAASLQQEMQDQLMDKDSIKEIRLIISLEEVEVGGTLFIPQNQLSENLEIIYGLPSLASFLYHDPASGLSQLQIPVLGLFGGNDSQVSIEQNKDRMEGTLLQAGANYHFVVFDTANHFFQESETGLRKEYDKLDNRFVEGFTAEISSWILGN